MGIDRLADIGDDALAEPGDAVEPAEGGDRQHGHHAKQGGEVQVEVAAVAHAEADVDDAADRLADAEHRGGGHHQRNRSEEHTSELQSLMRISYAAFCLKKKKNKTHS